MVAESCCARKSSLELLIDKLKAEKVSKLLKEVKIEYKVVYDLLKRLLMSVRFVFSIRVLAHTPWCHCHLEEAPIDSGYGF